VIDAGISIVIIRQVDLFAGLNAGSNVDVSPTGWSGGIEPGKLHPQLVISLLRS